MAKGNPKKLENNAEKIGVWYQGELDAAQSIFLNAINYERITISRKSRIIGTPVETGELRFDNKVLDPKVITVVGYVNTYEWNYSSDSVIFMELRKMFESRKYNDFWCVVSRGKGEENVYSNLMLQDYMTDEDPDHWGMDRVTLTFQEVRVQKQNKEQTASGDDSSTVDTGDSSPAVASNSGGGSTSSGIKVLT